MNYGWRVYEATSCTGLDPALCAGGATPITHTPPIFEYNHVNGRCSITGGYVYRGGIRTLPDGAYVFADYCTGEIWARVTGNPQLPLIDTSRLISHLVRTMTAKFTRSASEARQTRPARSKSSFASEHRSDFDGDLRTDVSVFRPSTGVWYVLNSSNSTVRIQQFGLNGDIAAPEDFDGDNITDIGVFRPSTGVWYSFRSSDNTVAIGQFGLAGDRPVQGDFDGDGQADRAVFRPSNGVWYVQRSSNSSVDITPFGISGDIPTAGDFDGDAE